MTDETKEIGFICGDGMCPYVPCDKYPKCDHIKKILEEDKNKWDEK